MEDAPRHVYGSRPVGALLPALTREAFKKRSPAAAQVMADWPSIIGPALARVTTPRRLARGTLTIGCAGPIAMELQYLAAEVMNRINTHLGSAVVTELKFHQVSLDFPAPPKSPQTPQRVIEAAEAAVADLPDGDLRSALAALGRAVLAGSTGSRDIS